jgi:uncharacterized repeat protein (TIGR01451 family)
MNHLSARIGIAAILGFSMAGADIASAAPHAPQATLQLVKTSDTPPTFEAHFCASTPPQEIAYGLRITNTGSLTETQLVLTDTLPSGMVYITNTAAPSITQIESNTLIWRIAELGPAQTITAHFAVQIPEPNSPFSAFETYTNTASLSSSQTPLTHSNPVIHQRYPLPVDGGSLCVKQSDGGVTAFAGSVVRYTLVYDFQPGFVPPTYTQPVVLVNRPPAHARFNPSFSTPGWVCGTVTCSLNAAVSPARGITGTAVFAVTVDEALPAGTQTLTHSVQTSDGFLSETTPIVLARRLYVPFITVRS